MCICYNESFRFSVPNLMFSQFLKPGLFLPPDTGGSCYVITIETGHGQTRAVEVECGNA